MQGNEFNRSPVEIGKRSAEGLRVARCDLPGSMTAEPTEVNNWERQRMGELDKGVRSNGHGFPIGVYSRDHRRLPNYGV